MNDKVKSLWGGAVPGGEPDHDIIESLEVLLEQAKAGEIRGLAFLATKPSGDIYHGVAGFPSVAMIGGLVLLQSHVSDVMWDESTTIN